MTMVAQTISNLSTPFLPRQQRSCSKLMLSPYCTEPIFRKGFAAKNRTLFSTPAAPIAAVDIVPTDRPIVVEKDVSIKKNILACPICYQPLSLISGGVVSVYSLQCDSCKKTYSSKETHFELTASSGSVEIDPMPLTTEFFRIPLISFLYERGWRQNFVWGGFPGPQKEFELMKDYLKPVVGGNIVDASCGSGLFSRLFAKSGLFSLVVALDYSESMLRQCYEFVKQEESFPKENLTLVRADISRLPFLCCSIDAVHAGAAIHCWPSPTLGVAEVSRVLRPGGVFVATTFILDGPFSFVPFLRPISQNISEISGSNAFLSESEIEDLCAACGLVGFKCIRNRQFVMFSASKPA